ncbi:MAG: glycoside hydrolase domain-containing protein [Bacteroidota bacterium]
MRIYLIIILIVFFSCNKKEEDVSLTDKVNVFMGTSYDHGQLSPAASVPFGLVKAGPQTSKSNHSGYNYGSDEFLGITHNRIEGVGCSGAGGNILVSPVGFTAKMDKSTEKGAPGYYSVALEEGLDIEVTTSLTTAFHRYTTDRKTLDFKVDLSHSFARFIDADFNIHGNQVTGWVEARNVCDKGAYKQLFHLSFEEEGTINRIDDNHFNLSLESNTGVFQLAVQLGDTTNNPIFRDFEYVKREAKEAWDIKLGHIKVSGADSLEALFYSNLYRTLLAPYKLSENGPFHGWSIWDNFRTSMPLWSMAYPSDYQEVLNSISGLYKKRKEDWARNDEPAPTVRTEHSQILLLDGIRKGYQVDLSAIFDSLMVEGERLDFGSPDKILESSYDLWALSEIADTLGYASLADSLQVAADEHKVIWKDKFLTMNERSDIMHGDGLYEGTLWQYRWFVPFDVSGIAGMTGGPSLLADELEYFFDNDLYNQGNQPDIQAPFLFNALGKPWLTQKWVNKILTQPMNQYYGTHSKWENPYHGLIFNNRPEAYIPEMDDDAGTMSAWYVLSSMGLYPACVGRPIYMLSAPIFDSVMINANQTFEITTEKKGKDDFYIQEVFLNDEPLTRSYIYHSEIANGGSLHFVLGDKPNTSFGAEMPYLEIERSDYE